MNDYISGEDDTSSGPFGCLIGRAIGGGFMIDGLPEPNQLA